MPPRFAYWTILVGGLPTAFRATERDELLPTFKRLQEKHPDAVMQWFSRGRLWESPEAAREALIRDREGDRPRGRGRDWRPGGEHRDPRQKFIDAKKARNLDRRKQRFERRQDGDKGTGRPPDRAGHERPTGPRADAPRDWRRPPGLKPEGRGEWKDRPARPTGPKPKGRGEWKDRPARPNGPKPEGRGEWKDRPARPTGPKPESRGEWKDRPRGPRPPGKPTGALGPVRPSGPRAPRDPRGPRGPRGPKR